MKKTKNYYSVYGLVIETFIEFPELYPISATDKTDAVISLGMPPEWVIKEYKSGKYSNIQNNIMWFRLNDEMLVYAENGNNVIVWQIDDNINPIRLRSYILTGALTLIMLQRDYVLVHGSGLVHNNKAFIISGTSGSGKSTTALNLLDKSEILFATDDICAIKTTDSGCYLYPGPPFQKICPDVKNKNNTDNNADNYILLEESGGKYGRRLSEGYVTAPVRISDMFILDKTDCTDIQLTEVTGINKLHALTHNLFRGELLHVVGITPERMQKLIKTADSFSIREVNRPKQKDTTTQLVDIIFSIIKTT